MKRDILRQISVIVTTLFALAVNAAAILLPLNGRSSAQISDSFNVLFVPAGYVFSIWGVIYIGLLAYTIYQALPGQRQNKLLQRTGLLVAFSSLANGAWLFAWHYGYYVLSLLVMLVLLSTLITIYLRLGIGRTAFSTIEKWTVSIPFSVYLGWITVATMANVTVVLSYLGWSGWGISPLTWTLLLLGAGVVVAALNAFTRSDIAYSLVLVWAFIGISMRWLNLPVLNSAGFVAAAFVFILLVASRLFPIKRMIGKTVSSSRPG
jgi:hypothetical protein